MANTVQIVVNLRDNASSALDGITSGLKGMATVAGGIIAADVIGRIGSGLAGVAMSGFDFTRSVENATAKLNAFTKDADVSAGILATLQEEAAKTPFAFEDMANAGAALLPVANNLNVDLMDLVRTAEILGALNPSEGLAGAAFALKEAASGDFTSIIERFDLPRQYINKLKEEGVPNMEIVSRAMADMGLDMDLVSNMADTFDGRMSTLKDTITTAAGAFAQPIFDWLSNQIFGLQGALDENMPAIEERLRTAGQAIADTLTTIQQAWSGEWVDSDVIQPLHRLAGETTLKVKEGWDTLVETRGKARAFWESGWLQTNVLEPLATLATQIRDSFVKDWEKLKSAWDKLHTVGESWNGLMEAGRELWNTLDGAVRAVGEALGIASTKGGDNNKVMKDANPFITTLIGLFDGLARFATIAAVGINLVVAGLKAFVNWINTAIGLWRELQGAVAAGSPVPYEQGVPVGGTDVGGTGSTTTGGTTVGGGVGVDNRGMAVPGGGVVVYATINNQMDLEEMAYRISRIQRERAF
jgi:hypothetical protein